MCKDKATFLFFFFFLESYANLMFRMNLLVHQESNGETNDTMFVPSTSESGIS